MLIKFIFLVTMLAGCAASFQPFPAQVKKSDVDAAIAAQQQSINQIILYIKNLQEQGVLPDPSKAVIKK